MRYAKGLRLYLFRCHLPGTIPLFEPLIYKEAVLTDGFWYTIRGSILACGLGQGGLWKSTGFPFTPRPSSP